MIRQQVIENLNEFYNQKGIIRDSFSCDNNVYCRSLGIDLAQGMQCHIGTEFFKREKVLVVSLDCGGGGNQYINERTKTIEDLINKNKLNPHMKGTIRCISSFFQMHENSKEALKYFAMTNSCKCTRNSNSKNKLPWKFYDKCSDLKKDEIRIINPDIIFFQGKDSLVGCKFIDIPSVPDEMKEFIKYLLVDDKMYISVICIHPSARGRHAKRRKDFYENKIDDINGFIRDRLLKNVCQHF